MIDKFVENHFKRLNENKTGFGVKDALEVLSRLESIKGGVKLVMIEDEVLIQYKEDGNLYRFVPVNFEEKGYIGELELVEN